MGTSHEVASQAILCEFSVTPCTIALQAAPSADVQGAAQEDTEEEDVLFSVDLEARKAGLRAQLAVYAKVNCFCMPQ